MIERIERTAVMHRVVKHSGVVYLGGVIADDVQGISMRGQALQIFAKIDALLENAGSNKCLLLAGTIFVTDIRQKRDVNDAWALWLDAADFPTRSTIGVADLGQDVLIEVVVTAVS